MKRRDLLRLSGALAAGRLPGQTVPTEPAALVVVNARIWTGAAGQPWAEALTVAGSLIQYTGSTPEATQRAGTKARRIDAKGGLIVPGFIDSHVHFVTGGFRLSSVQLRTAKTKEEFVARIGQFAATLPKGAWMTGGDWDHTVWGGALPERGWIDEVSGDHPVWINRLDGHMALANSLALKAGGVTKASAEISGGAIVRDQTGNPTGLLKDNAMGLVARVVPPRGEAEYDRALQAAVRYVTERGVTSVHHMGGWDDVAAFDRAVSSGRLGTRVYAAVPLPTWERLAERVAERGKGGDVLRLGNLKAYVDGSLGSHTAAMLDGYNDLPRDTGLLVNKEEDLYRWTSGAAKAGLQVSVHAIGDRANRTILDIFERVQKEQPKAKDARFRVEHSQHIAPADIPRFGKLGVIPSMQPYHCIDDGRWAEKLIGPERARGTYAFRTLIDTGAKPAFGSDWFVAPPTPLEGIYAAVTRRTLDDKHPDGWVPEQKITVKEALRAYTAHAAFASFEEGKKGTLQAGRLADFVLLDRDITRIHPAGIKDARVLMTAIGGKIAYTAGM